MRVDFPDPEGPIRATYSPLLICKSMPLSTLIISVPNAKSRFMLDMLINGCAMMEKLMVVTGFKSTNLYDISSFKFVFVTDFTF
jgi:hypothetical protein